MVCEHEYMNIAPPPQLSSLLRHCSALKGGSVLEHAPSKRRQNIES
jgi:hypothetical protein